MRTALALLLLLTVACRNTNDKKEQPADNRELPKPGAIVASVEEPIKEDTLNKFTYSIKVIADSNIAAGEYDVDVDYGPNFAQGQLTMPKGGEHLVPIIRKGSAPYTYVIGFRVPYDTAFYEYFEVSSSHSATKMQYIKAYTF